MQLPMGLETFDLRNTREYVVTRQLLVDSKFRQIPASLTQLRLPPARFQNIDGQSFTLPPNLRELHNWCSSQGFTGMPNTLTSLWYDCGKAVSPGTINTTLVPPDWSTCPHLTDLNLQDAYPTHPLSTFRLPACLLRLSGVRASQIDAAWVPPEGLLELRLLAGGASEYEAAIQPQQLRLPSVLRVLSPIPQFHRGVDYTMLSLPESLVSALVHPVPGMENLQWPSGMRELTYADVGLCTEGNGLQLLMWNEGLEILRFTKVAGQQTSIVNWNPPSSLTELILPSDWNASLLQLQLPPRLRKLTFGYGWDQQIGSTDIIWPDTLEAIIFGEDFHHSLANWTPPPNLTHLRTPSEKYWLSSFTAREIKVPVSLRRLELRVSRTPLIFDSDEWPALEYLEVCHPPEDWSVVCLPPRLHTLHIEPLTRPEIDLMLINFDVLTHLRWITSREINDIDAAGLISRIRELLPSTCSFFLLRHGSD